MKRFILVAVAVLSLTGCNSIHIDDNAMLAPGAKIFAVRGGYSMQREMKQVLEERGYDVIVGTSRPRNKQEATVIDNGIIPADTPYAIQATERKEKFMPYWCLFNGIWWWNFNLSIVDQQTGKELMTWRGRGCAHSSLNKLNKILDKMEKRYEQSRGAIDTGNHSGM